MASIISATTTNGLSTSADNSGSLQLATNNGTTAVTIDTSQNVGVGTSSPQARLHVSDAVAGGQLLVTTNETNSTSKIGSLATMHYTNSQAPVLAISVEGAVSDNIVQVGGGPGEFNASTQVRFFTAANNTTTGGTERMRITSGGDLFIGTSTANTVDGSRLYVYYNGDNGIVSRVDSANFCYVAQTGNGSNNGTAMSFRWTNTQVGRISTTSSATSYVTSSDYRLKENITPMIGALDKVALLKPVTYKWKVDGSDGQGFIAHELAEVVPEAVNGEKDAVETYTDEEGNEQTRPVYQGVDTSFLVATLTAAIQELKAELDATKAEVQALKGVA